MNVCGEFVRDVVRTTRCSSRQNFKNCTSELTFGGPCFSNSWQKCRNRKPKSQTTAQEQKAGRIEQFGNVSLTSRHYTRLSPSITSSKWRSLKIASRNLLCRKPVPERREKRKSKRPTRLPPNQTRSTRELGPGEPLIRIVVPAASVFVFFDLKHFVVHAASKHTASTHSTLPQ